MPPQHLHLGDLVTGTVTEHRPFGVFIDIGDPADGLAVITMIQDAPNPDALELPAVGQKVEAVFLGYTEQDGQPRLSLRPRDIAAARR